MVLLYHYTDKWSVQLIRFLAFPPLFCRCRVTVALWVYGISEADETNAPVEAHSRMSKRKNDFKESKVQRKNQLHWDKIRSKRISFFAQSELMLILFKSVLALKRVRTQSNSTSFFTMTIPSITPQLSCRNKAAMVRWARLRKCDFKVEKVCLVWELTIPPLPEESSSVTSSTKNWHCSYRRFLCKKRKAFLKVLHQQELV